MKISEGIKVQVGGLLVAIVLFVFVLAIKVNAHDSNCSAQWNSCTSPCTINIGIKGTAWYDGCMSQCSQQHLDCETAFAKSATSCFDQWRHCTSPCMTSIGVWGVGWYDGCDAFCNTQKTACDNQGGSAPAVNTPPTTKTTGCAAGDWDLNGKCLSKDEWCNTTYGNSHEENGKCPCNTGYKFLNGACGSEDEVCRAISANASVKNGQCSCDDGYGELNNKCVTIEQWCQATYGADSHAENGSCVSASQQVKIPTQPSTRPALKPIININKTQTPSVKKSSEPTKETSRTRQLSVQEIQAITVYLFGAMGYDADDFDRAMETIDEIFKAARGVPSRKELNDRALAKRKSADKEFIEAARDGRIKNAETRERIRKMYLDSWLDNPQDKKADMMMAIFEKDKGNNDTADVFEKFAYMNLAQKERNTLTTAVNKAKESMAEKLMREKVNKTLLQKQLDNSAVMNQLKQNVNGEIVKAQETAKDACYGNSACDWVWTKKVGIITEAQKMSQSVRDLMNDPIKFMFGIDRKQITKDFYAN